MRQFLTRSSALDARALVRHIYLMGAVLKYWSRHEGFGWANDGFLDWNLAWFRHWSRRKSGQEPSKSLFDKG